MLTPFHYAFVQRGLLEVLLLSVSAGVLGTWIVLRGLAFFSHAVATAAFPGLVLADGLGFAGPLGAFAAALVFVFGVERLARTRRSGHDALTALVLVGALSLGVILASDVFHSHASVETLLFGSLLAIGGWNLALAGAVAVVVLVVAAVFGERWLAVGFDAGSARSLGVRSGTADAILLATIALATVSALAAIGVMLTSALFVIPAATVRIWVRNLRRWQLASVALAAAEGVVGLWVSVKANVPPGAAIAVLAGSIFAIAALARTRAKTLLAGVAAALLLAGCGSTGAHHGVLVVATTTQIGEFAREVGGSAVTVHQILQPNTDPHEYEPRPNDVIAANGAAIVFESGRGLDGWIDKVIARAGGHPRVVDLGAAIPFARSGDPHWWHDPRNAEAAVAAIRDALEHADPDHSALYARNATRYLRALQILDEEIAVCFEQVPPAQRKLVTSHDAFGYFAALYRVTVVGAVIPSQTTQAQASAREVARLIALIRREHVKAIFPESSINPQLADQIARATGATARYTLYGDTLGPSGSPGATYIGMEHANADAMVRGFTGGREHC
jgi:ABC-type Zn uptake system ZnuABC Zn-binding protein ZnuA/ABC-type Mn2+/Zn2+ transport system permease subunit